MAVAACRPEPPRPLRHPLETELKLALPPAALPRLRRHPLFRNAHPVGEPHWLDNRYFDTPAHRLAAHHVALRLRLGGGQRLRTVKGSSPSVAGLSRRAEWEITAPRGVADAGFADVDDAGIRRLLERHAHHLREVFLTRFRRETRRLEPRRGVSILLMLDRGRISAQGHNEPICELELELERGQPADLFELASRLAVDLPLQPEDRSKADRGYRLAGLTRPEPMSAPLRRRKAADAPAIEAFKASMDAEIGEWRALLGKDAACDTGEFLHRSRVIQRRLRTLLRLYAPALPQRFVAEWDRRLATDARRLGAARELDVLCSTLQEQPSLHRSDAGRRLRQHAQAAREEALAAALAASGPRRQMSTLLQLQGAMLRLHGGASAEAPAASLVAEGLDKLRRRVRRRLREVDAAAHPGRDPHVLHRLRLAVKDLRNAAVAAAAIGVTTRDPTRIGALADDLGGLQDIAAARRQLREWANADTRLASPIADLVAGLEPRHRRLLARALRRARQI